MGQYQELTKNCIHGRLPDCACLCPFRIDTRDFTEKLQRGRFDAAYRLYRDAVLFPEIVSRLCRAPCQGACSRRDTDAPVRRLLLERAAVQYASRKNPIKLNVPGKEKRVAVIGAGPSGLACALRMAMRKYRVTVYEQGSRPGGSLLLLPEREIFLSDIENQFQNETWDFVPDTKITDLSQVEADAVYIATGAGGEDFGLLEGRRGLLTVKDGVFIGGGVLGGDAIDAIRDGMQAADRMESYLKTGRMEEGAEPAPCGNQPDPAKLAYTPAVEPGSDGLYTQEQAKAEASRCLLCDCDICQRACPLMAYYKRYPGKIAELTEGTVLPIDLHYHRLATRMVVSCDQCGICGDACPKDIDVGSFILDARRTMVRQGDMPKAFSAFFLDDMAHANGPDAYILTGAEPGGKCSHVFFPGCQLGASDPRYVSLTFERLRRMHPDSALLAACCGAPAGWAGYEALHAEAAARIREAWRNLGEPVFICACFTCMKMLADTLPEIQTISLYQMDWAVSPVGNGAEVSVFDPCASRHNAEAQRSVRELLTKAGFVLSPLQTARPVCCGWGGQYEIANPAMARGVVENRIHLSDAPFVTYCSNCRDIFAKAGKRALHVLDILLGINDDRRAPPTWTQRRKNRASLRRKLLGETAAGDGHAPPFRLTIPPELSRELSERWILEEDAESVVRHCEQTGEKLLNPKTGTFIGHRRLKNFTCWAVYRKTEDGFELVNAYSHRMQIAEA